MACLLLVVSLHAQIITTIAGNGTKGNNGDNGIATNATLAYPISLTIDVNGNIYIADEQSNNVRKITRKGIISTVAGSGIKKYDLSKPHGVVADRKGNLYITEYDNHIIRKITGNGTSTVVAGIPFKPASFGYNDAMKAATASAINTPNGIAIDASGNIYFADQWNYMILKISADNTLSVVAGNGFGGNTGNKGSATAAEIQAPWGVATDKIGNIYFTDITNHTVHKIDTTGEIWTIAGTGKRGYSGDNGPATSATLNEPHGIKVDDSGNIYIADAGNHVIRCIYSDNTISTIAGTGHRGYSGDGGQALNAGLSYPCDIAIDKKGSLFIADAGNHVIRKIVQPLQKHKIHLTTELYHVIANAETDELILSINQGTFNKYTITGINDKLYLEGKIVLTDIHIDIHSLPSVQEPVMLTT